jgi:hypothetical protein
MTRRNMNLLTNTRSYRELRDLIVDSLIPELKSGYVKAVRVHVGGDFYSQRYFDAWMAAASRFKHITFYAYTKSIKFWLKGREKGIIPENFKLTASDGGKYDHLIEEHNLRKATVLMHPDEAKVYNVEIDHDDSHARGDGGDFGLLLHGRQPAGSEAAEAQKRMREEGVKYSYDSGYKKKPMDPLPKSPVDKGYQQKTRTGSESGRAHRE